MVIRLFLICSLFFMLMGCQSNTNELKQSSPIVNLNPGNDPEADKLIKTINEYYNLEKKESWDKAYEYRTPLFRQTVLKDDYIKQMSKDNEGWQLLRFDILDLKIENNRATAKIKFIEKCPREVKLLWKKIKDYNISCEGDTKWIKYGDKWFSLDPDDRTHFALNTELVLE